jgi:alpha-glucosidase
VAGRRACRDPSSLPLDDSSQSTTALELTLTEGEADSLALNIGCDDEGTFSGFGGQYNHTDQRGERFPLWVNEQGIGRDPEVEENPPLLINGDLHTTYTPAPWYVDARGWGVFVDTARRVDVDLCASDPDVAWLELVERNAPLRARVMHGPTPKDVIRQLGAHVGRPASPPDWAFLPWIAAQGGRDEVLAEVDALEAAGVPFGALWVQDWTGIRMNLDGGFGVQYRWLPDETLYPDLAGMIASIQSRGHRFLGYANPFVPTNLDHFDEMAAMGLLLGDPMAPDSPYLHVAPNGVASQPDLTNEAARDYVKGFLRDMVTVYGMDGWMADFSEWLPLDAQLSDGSRAIDQHNHYPREWQRLTREVMDEVRPAGDWVMFARAGWPGVQAVSQIHWIGDQEADWSEYDGLPTVVPALINLGLSGVPIVTHDIAGFSGGPSSKELWQRWTELGAFTPIMRTHEGANKLENWSWESDAETTDHFRRFATIHEILAPELNDLVADAGERSTPMIRHMMLEFPDDPATWGLSDQFMLGPELLVAPITEQGSTSRTVYLPEGSWWHVWTGETHDGPASITIDAPIGSPPVFSLERDRPDLRAIP